VTPGPPEGEAEPDQAEGDQPRDPEREAGERQVAARRSRAELRGRPEDASERA